jgi:predicted CxxxxCH...CXXCH cytochrome family protein
MRREKSKTMTETLKRRSTRNRLLLILLGIILVAGCSTSNSNSDLNLIDAQGSHPQDFLSTHPVFALVGTTQCTSCHGSNLTGGIANVSCFTSACHHGTIPTWAQPNVHGASAKQAPGKSSFVACQLCHGSNFFGGESGVSCATCHGVYAPHPPKPWRIPGTTDFTHTSTDPANAPVCVACHFPGSLNNPAGNPLTPASAGTAPGCFNSTLCHGAPGSTHIAGWASPDSHGASAKSAPDTAAVKGFAACQLCHGSGFSGGASGATCLNTVGCHGVTVAAPHSPKPWRGGVRTHTTTDAGNALICATCHFPGSPSNPAGHPSTPAPAGTTPGCFNSTLCHGTSGAPHALGATWLDATSAAFHGLAAKPDLVYCQGCHGTPGTIFFDGGAATTKCSTCHAAAKAHPTTWYLAPGPFPSYIASHRNAGNRSVACATCHNVSGPGAGPMNAAPSCLSASFTNANGVAAFCHANGPGAASHAVPFLDAAHIQSTPATFTSNCSNCHAVTGSSPAVAAPLCTICHTAGSPLTSINCTSCHATPPNGAAGAVYPNIAGNHAVHLALNSAGTPISCNTCHNGLGTTTLNHYNRANARSGLNALRIPPGDAAFLSAYNAKTGASLFDNSAVLSCANVSCHGGQATPNWQTGILDVNTQCASCHALGTVQFNSYNSGRHNLSQHRSRACTVCHNTTTLAVNHFTTLGTAAMEGPASATIGGAGTNVNTYVAATRSCTPSCHATQTW